MSQQADSAILDGAENVFGWKGYRNTTMEAIAREAKVSVGSLYNGFKNKDDLYAQVAQRIGRAAVSRIEPLLDCADPEEAVLEMIRLRVHNHARDRLFFQPFSFPAYLSVQPEPARLGEETNRLYQQYVELVDRIIARSFARAGQEVPPGVNMAASLEGMITALVEHWSDGGRTENLSRITHHLRALLLNGLDAAADGSQSSVSGKAVLPRSVYISRYDLDRLTELISVVRAFGKQDCQQDADALAEELKRARVTNPKEVPPDVVTMNSRVRVTNMGSGMDQIYSLVFPKDAESGGDSVSVLTAFGTALLGRRVGDVFSLGSGHDALIYQVGQIMYQPEAAGDYHL